MKKNNLLNLSEHDAAIFANIITHYNCTIYAYGSRTKGTNQKFSDLDLYITNADDVDIEQLKEDLENSDLSIKVDIHEEQYVSKDFKTLITPNFVEIKRRA